MWLDQSANFRVIEIVRKARNFQDLIQSCFKLISGLDTGDIIGSKKSGITMKFNIQCYHSIIAEGAK